MIQIPQVHTLNLNGLSLTPHKVLSGQDQHLVCLETAAQSFKKKEAVLLSLPKN